MTALADRVKESTTTTGTGSLTLSGAVAQFESFNTAFGTAAPFYYVITDANGTDWEVGTGELSNATTLVRTTVHQSSNADAKINLSAGTHTVFCSAPAVFLAGLASKSGKLSQFAATTSAELAGVISDETGSGALVFATSPTLTTPNIGVATATSVNGTTIPSSKTLVVTTDKLSALAATTSAELAGVISDETGTGSLVFASSPSLTTPNIGAATATSVNGTTIPSSKTLVVTTDKLSALAATTSAELAGVISDETGSGSLVFATSPSLTTPNIGTPSAGTLTNCTGLPVGGVSGLGTGVGTALAVNTGSAGAFVVNGGALGTPSSGTLTNATGLPVSTGVSGLGTGVATALAVNTGSAGAVVVNGGALGTPSSGTLTNATGLPVSTGVSGLGTGVATALAVNTGSSGAVVVNGGALGTPSSGTVTNLTGTASININGTVGATTANTGAFTTLSATGNVNFDGGSFVFNESGADKDFRVEGDTDANLLFVDASTDRVGIGTNAPGALLHVSADAAKIRVGVTASSQYTDIYRDNATGYTIYNAAQASPFRAHVWQLGGTEAARIDSSGNVLVGSSSSPGFGGVTPNFQVTNTSFTGSDVDGGTIATFGSSTYGVDKGSGVVFGFKYNTAGSYVTAARVRGAKENATDGNYAGYLGFDTRANGGNLTERMRIDSSGNVGIGTSSPGARLQSTGAAATASPTGGSSSGAGLYINNTDAAYGMQFGVGSGGSGWIQQQRSDGSNTQYNLLLQPIGGEVIAGGTTDQGAYNLQCNGTAVWGAGAYVNGSDARIKEDVAPIQSGLDVVAKLNPVTFRYKQSWSKDQNIQPGFIAQELQAAMVDEVYVDGVVQQGPEYMSVAYQSLIPILTKAIQEQQQQIDALKAEVAALKGNA